MDSLRRIWRKKMGFGASVTGLCFRLVMLLFMPIYGLYCVLRIQNEWRDLKFFTLTILDVCRNERILSGTQTSPEAPY